MGNALPQKPFPLKPLTPAQGQFWTLLQDEQNRGLPLVQLCQKAGYKGMAPWYKAIRDEQFRDMLESLGVVIHRQRREPEVRGVVPLYASKK